MTSFAGSNYFTLRLAPDRRPAELIDLIRELTPLRRVVRLQADALKIVQGPARPAIEDVAAAHDGSVEGSPVSRSEAMSIHGTHFPREDQVTFLRSGLSICSAGDRPRQLYRENLEPCQFQMLFWSCVQLQSKVAYTSNSPMVKWASTREAFSGHTFRLPNSLTSRRTMIEQN